MKKISNIIPLNTIKKIAKNSGWLLIDKGTRLILGLLVTTWIARYLGPSQYGVLAYVIAFVAFFQALLPLGMDGIMVRDIAKGNLTPNKAMGTVFLARFIFGIFLWLALIIIMGGVYSFKNQYTILSAIIGASLIFQSADTIDLWFQSQSESKRTVLAKLCAYAVVNLFKILLLLFKAPLIAFAYAALMEFVVTAVGMAMAYRTYPIKGRWEYSLLEFKKMISESWPFIISGFSIIIYMRFDQIFIKHYLPLEYLGIYFAILPLATLWSFIPVTLSVSLAPFLSKLKDENEDKYQDFIFYIFKGFAILGWIICLPVSFLSYYIVLFMFGSQYISGALVLSILIFVNLFINMGVAQSLWILNEKKSKLSLFKTLIGAVVSILANIILIPQYGLAGAAISAVLAQLFSTVLSNIILAPEIFEIQIRCLFMLPKKEY